MARSGHARHGRLAVRAVCAVPGCEIDAVPHQRGGLCRAHDSRMRRTGSVRADRPVIPLGTAEVDRLLAWVEKDSSSGCWNWTGKLHNGYGVSGGKFAHCRSWRLLRGPIPDGLQIDHLCRNRRCVNPDHLEPVTPRENMVRALPFRPGAVVDPNSRLYAFCKAGHQMSGDNLAYKRDGRRKCLACAREYQRAYRDRLAQKSEAS
jgi:hypothetical protein